MNTASRVVDRVGLNRDGKTTIIRREEVEEEAGSQP
jgi:hypothetical protein